MRNCWVIDGFDIYIILSLIVKYVVVSAIKPHKLSTKMTHHISQCIPYEVVNLRNFITPKISESDEEGEVKVKVAKALSDFIFSQLGVKVHILSYGPASKHKHFVN